MSLTPDGIGHIEYASESYAGPHGSGLLEEDTRYSPATTGQVQHQQQRQFYNLTAYEPAYDLQQQQQQEHQQLYLPAESEQIEEYYQQDVEPQAQHEVYSGLLNCEQPGLPLRFETYGEYAQEEQLAYPQHFAYQQPLVYEEQSLPSQEQFPDQEQQLFVAQETPPPSLPEQEVAGVEQFAYQEQVSYEEQLADQLQEQLVVEQESPPEAKPAINREKLFLGYAESPGTEHLRLLQAPTHRLANSVRNSLRYIRESCDRLTAEHDQEEAEVQAQIHAVLKVREKLLDVCQLLVGDDNPQAWSLLKEIVVGFESETLSKLLLNERRSNGAPWDWKNEQRNPMGLDLLNRIRNLLAGWYKHNDTSSEPDEGGSGSGPAGDQQPNNRSFPRKRRFAEDEPPLIKYRRVDNSFPRFITNEAAAEDYAPTRSMAERERERERERENHRPGAKRLSIFNAPTITQQRVRNNVANIPIDLSDDDEPFPSYGLGASYRPPAPTGRSNMNCDSSTSSSLAVRPQLLYSDAVRLGQNGFPESRMMNGHHGPRSPPHVEDSLLNQEERRSEREQYLALLRNLCHDKSAIRTTPRPNPPPLQLLHRPAAEPPTWGSILAGNRPLPSQQQQQRQQPPPPLALRPVNNHANRELADYARLLDHREQRKITPPPPPLMLIKSARSITSHASTISSSESISSSSSSEDSDEIHAIDDSSDDKPIPVVNHNGPSHSASSQLNTTVPLHELMQRRFANSVFFKDNFAENFKLKIERQRKELEHRRELAISEAEKSHDARRAFERSLRENIFQFRLTHKPLLIIGSLDKAADKKESEFIPLTEEHMKRYTELIQGAPQQVLVSKFSLQIHRSDIRTLLGSSWLNDEVINFYMSLLTERSELRAGELPSVYAMNTFFVPRLLQNGHGGVKRWTRKVDLFSKDIIPVPVHCNGVHWCMAIIHMRNKTIKYYDSMGKPNQDVLDALESYLRQESLDKRKQPFDTSGFKIESVPNVPQQTNGSDCGVFSCMFAEYITRDAPITFSQEHMDYFRKKMVLEIAGGQLWL